MKWLPGLRRGTAGLVSEALLAAALSTPAFALDPTKGIRQYGLDVWDSRSGLPNQTINAIRRTSDGYLWLGTDAGLVRFDGDHFVLFDTSNVEPMLVDRVQSLLEDEEGTLLVGTFGGGALRRRNGRFESVGTTGVERSAVIYGFSRGKGRVWVAMSTHGGIGVIEGDILRADPLDLRTGAANSVAWDEQRQRLWMGHDSGLLSLHEGTDQRVSRQMGLAGDIIVSIHVARNGDLWLARRSEGIQRWRGGVVAHYGTREGLPGDGARVVMEDRDGNIWVGTTRGLARLNGSRVETLTADQGLPPGEVLSLNEDSEGSLWIGTAGGLARLKDGTFTTFTTHEGLPDNGTNAVLEAHDGSIWVGTDAGLARMTDGGVEVLTTRQGLPNNRILGLWEEPGRGLWVGTEAGPARVENGKVVANPALEALRRAASGRYWVRSLREHEGMLWVAGEDMRRVPTKGGDVEIVPRTDPSREQTLRFFTDSRDALWAGSWDGLLSLSNDSPARTLEVYRSKDGRTRGSVVDGLSATDGALWLATRDRGLCRYRNGTPSCYGRAEGLPANNVYSLIMDDSGHLWLATGRGIARVSIEELNQLDRKAISRLNPLVFGASDGLRAAEARFGGSPGAWRSRDGRIYFCTTNGLAVVDPRRVSDQSRGETPLVIQTLVSGKQHLESFEKATLAPGSSDIEIHYAGLSLSAPEKIRFRYRLEGVDADWVEAGSRRVAYYTRLDPRAYIFRLSATTPAGSWSEKEARIDFLLEPHFHQTTWFRLLLVGLALAVSYGIFTVRMRQIRAHRQELESLVAQRTAELEGEIGDHRRAEERLEEERDLLHALMDNIPDLIYFKDLEQRYSRVNQAHATAVGLATPKDAQGKTDADFYSEDFAAISRADESQILQTGVSLTGRTQLDAKSGRYYLATKVPTRDLKGEVSGLVGISKDITERRQAEEAFREFVRSVAAGDLTRRSAEGREAVGEIGRMVNEMLRGFTAILSEVRDASFSVSASSSEILATSTQIAKGAQYSRDQVFTTTSAVEEMARSMRLIASSAEDSAQAAQRVMEHLGISDESVEAATRGMDEIDQAVSETAEKMRQLGERSGEVFAIIDLIEDIASRSELLSLNASIEAAHAGDSGRGFAVVADEIRRLSERSTAAIKQVTDIVKGMATETRAVLLAMEQTTTVVKRGVQLSESTRRALEEISALVQQAAQLAGQISASAQEQTMASQTASEAMLSIANNTDEAAAAASQTSRAVGLLVQLADQLTASISRFKIDATPELTNQDSAKESSDVVGAMRDLAAAISSLGAGSPAASASDGNALEAVHALSGRVAEALERMGRG